MNENKPVSKVLVLDDCPAHVEAHQAILRREQSGRREGGARTACVGAAHRISIWARSSSPKAMAARPKRAPGSRSRSTRRAPNCRSSCAGKPSAMLDDLAGGSAPRGVRALTSASDMASLREVIDEYIFSLDYPNALVRGIFGDDQSVLGSSSRYGASRWIRRASFATASSSAKCSA